MFLTGAAFPLPRLTLFTLFGRDFALPDLLPPTHAVVALNKIFTLGAGLQDVAFELAALTLLSVLYFGLGVWLFQRTQMTSRWGLTHTDEDSQRERKSCSSSTKNCSCSRSTTPPVSWLARRQRTCPTVWPAPFWPNWRCRAGRVADKRLAVLDASPTGDELLDGALAVIAASAKPRKLTHWINTIVSGSKLDQACCPTNW